MKRRRFDIGGLAQAAPDEDESADGYSLSDELGGGDDPSADISASGGLTALDFPGAREAFALMAKSSADARAALQRARESIMARKYNRAIPLLAASAALGAPTRAGSTAESFANMSGALIGPLQQKQAFEQGNQKELLGIDTQMAGLDQNSAAAQLKLAELSARLANDKAKAGNDIVKGPDGKWHFASHADARDSGAEAFTPPPPQGQFVLSQQPLPDGTIQPVITNARTGEVKPTGDAYKPVTKLSGTAALQAKGKLATTQIIRSQLADVRARWKDIKNTWQAGKLQGWVPSPKGEAFDKAVAAMRGTVRQLTRVPGEGSMSDWEGKIDQAKLPERGDYEDVTEQTFDQLESLINGYETTTKDMLGITPVLKFDKEGKPIK